MGVDISDTDPTLRYRPSYQEVVSALTWTLDAVADVVRQVVHDVQQEGEVLDVVHVDDLRRGGDGPQLVHVRVLHA